MRTRKTDGEEKEDTGKMAARKETRGLRRGSAERRRQRKEKQYDVAVPRRRGSSRQKDEEEEDEEKKKKIEVEDEQEERMSYSSHILFFQLLHKETFLFPGTTHPLSQRHSFRFFNFFSLALPFRSIDFFFIFCNLFFSLSSSPSPSSYRRRRRERQDWT